jgi:hypothetical protein
MVAALDGVSAAGAEITPSQGSKMPGVTGSMLMLVREWNPESGTLTGWLPMHRAAIQLELFDKLPPPHLNDALNVIWLPAKDFDPPGTEVRVSPPSRLIEGQRWLPAERDANIVRVAKRLFLVRKVIFGGSRWRLPTKFSESTTRRDPVMPRVRARLPTHTFGNYVALSHANNSMGPRKQSTMCSKR